jgi:hypothetical protein
LFGKFWKEYPRKDAKQRAAAWFQKNNPTEEDVGKMLNTISFQKKQIGGRLNCERQYIPLPCTWLNDGDWRDAPTKAESEQDRQAREKAGLEKVRREKRSEYGPWIKSADEKTLTDFYKNNIHLRWLVKELRPDVAGRTKGK